MADQKLTELTTLTVLAGEDLLLVVDDPSGTPASKKITVLSLLSQLPSNTTFEQDVTVQGNTAITGTLKAANDHIQITGAIASSSNNATTMFGRSDAGGAYAYDLNYLYVAVSNTTVKRVALSDWDS